MPYHRTTRFVAPRDFNNPPRKVWAIHNSEIVSYSGKRFIDLSSGAGSLTLGGFDANIFSAIHSALTMPYAHSNSWYSEPADKLAFELLKRTESKDFLENGLVVFFTSGSEAIEAAAKIAIQYQIEKGADNKNSVTGRIFSYHGNTLYSLGIGDHTRKEPYYKICYKPPVRLPAFAPSRHTLTDQGGKSYENRVLNETYHLLKPHKEEIAGIVIETVGGTAIGIEPPTKNYYTRLYEMCKDLNIISVLDEILCGTYRCGPFYAWQNYANTPPDICVLGKALTAGLFPLYAIVLSPDIVNTIKKGSGKIWHTSTNQNHALGCSVGLSAINQYDTLSKDQKCTTPIIPVEKTIEGMFSNKNLSKFSNLKVVGKGALWGMRINGSQSNMNFADIIRLDLLQYGISVYTERSPFDPTDAVIMLAPAYNIQLEKLEKAIETVFNRIQTL